MATVRMMLVRLKSANDACVLPVFCELIEHPKEGVQVLVYTRTPVRNEPIKLLFPTIGTFCLYYELSLAEFANELGRQLEAEAERTERLGPQQTVNRESVVKLKPRNAALTSVTKPLKRRKSSSGQ